jgi:hypothetical protein
LPAAKTLVFSYEAPTADPSDTAAMKLANPASWITEEFLARQAANPELTDAQVLQLHGCVWAETESTFVAPPLITQAMRGFRPLEDGERVVLGFDGAERRDETWLVACSLDGRVQPLARWARPRGQDDWRVPRPEVHGAVAEAFDRFDVVELAADPPGWHSEIDEWTVLYGERVMMFDTNKPSLMAPACGRARTALVLGELRFGGPLGADLASHFGHCVAVEKPAGIVVTKDHPDSPRKIDGAVASVIAYDRAMWHQANTPEPFYGMAAL